MIVRREARKLTAEQLRFVRLLRGVRSEGVLAMKGFWHHGSVSTYRHCLRVAWQSFTMNRRLHLHADERALVRAAMLHDYFGYDWHSTDNGGHALNHPCIACRRADAEFSLSAKERNAISAHMWPLPPTRVPRSREAWIICAADKVCALQETLFMRCRGE